MFKRRKAALLFMTLMATTLIACTAADEITRLVQRFTSPRIPAGAPTVTLPQVPSGPPMVWVSAANDPDWPGCEDTEEGCRTELMLNYPDNPGIKAISLTAAYDFTYVNTPAISHDSTRIAFAGTRGDVTDIYLIDLDGSNLREVTSGKVGSFNFRPVWDPFDNVIAYASNRDGDNRWNIIIHTLATGEMLAFNSEQYNTGLFNDSIYNIRFFDWFMTGDPGTFVGTTDLADPEPGDCWPDCLVGLYFYDMGTDEMDQNTRSV